ncbi:MAG: RHS repeat-associated core domain-containing protein, partial [bacterium]
VRDEIGRISTVSEASLGIIAKPSFVGPARHAKVEYGNGLALDEAYDAAARPVSMRVEDAQHNVIAGFEVGYDRAGQKLYERRLHDQGKGELYQYDSANRLIASSQGVMNSEQHIGEPMPGAFSNHVTYAIDPVHNWSSRVEYRDPSNTALNISRTYAPNTLNQYAAMSKAVDGGAPSNTSFVYDEAGNLIDDGKYRYTYDDRNLVTEVRNAITDDIVTQYSYDALRRRTSELRADGKVTAFIYDGWQEVQEITDGTLTASYIYDDGIDHPIAMIANGHAYYYHADSRNNIAAITDESGALVERYAYDPYGAATITDTNGNVQNDSTIGNAYRFSSRRYDEATGLYYYRHRMYSPQLGRFLQRDPEWYVDGMNVYVYVGNNPILWIDPYGLSKGATDLHGYTQKDFGKALEAAGIVMDASSVTVTSLRAFEIGGKGLLYISKGMTYFSTVSTAYNIYEGVTQGDALKTVSAGMDLTIGIATLAIESESPAAAAAITVVYVGGKWGILTVPDGYGGQNITEYSNGGAGAVRMWP